MNALVFIVNGPCYGGSAFISPSPSRWTLHGMSRHIKEVLSVKQFRVDGPEDPVISPLQFHDSGYSALDSVRRGTTRGPGQGQQSNHTPWLALVFPLPRRRSLLSIIQWLFSIPHQCFFSPRQSTPPRLYPLARIRSTYSYILRRYGIVLRRKGPYFEE